MEHNGLYTDLDSFTNLTNCGTTNSSFGDTCPPLPSLNNFKYQQPNISSNIYQQPVQTLHDQQQHQHKSAPLPQTQININNCNNNIFYPHDDGIFDATATCASTTVPSSGNVNNQKNNFIGYVRKEPGGGGGDNITYNINNINTNIVNNINNPANVVNGSSDVFSGNQYHQINKNGETIINFTNNNLNTGATTSMPADTVAATSQNYYGYQTNNVQGQQTIYESSVQQTQSSTFLDPKPSMATTGAGPYHQSALNQTMTNGSGYLPGNSSSMPAATSVDQFSEYSEPLSTAKIINNFEAKNPLKYPTTNKYYKPADYQFPSHLPHNYSAMPKIPPTHTYEPYPRLQRNTMPLYPTQHYQDEHNASQLNYNRTSGPIPPYHHPHSLQHPPANYGNYYGNGYTTMPYSAYPQMPLPGPSYVPNQLIRNESCSKPTANYNKTGAVAHSPVEHSNYSLPPSYVAPKKDFYADNHYYHPYTYEDPANSMLNSCAKKASGRPKVNADMYNPNGATIYPDHHAMPHHPSSRNMSSYQPMPMPHRPTNSYQMPPANSCDLTNPYHNYNYHYKSGEPPKMQKINPAMSTKQFKSYGHFEPLPHPPHITYGHPPQYHTMQAKHPEKIKISIDLEEQINSSKIPKMPHPGYGFDPHHHYYQYHPYQPSRNVIDNDPTKNPIANINISLRDFLSTWNEIDDEDEGRQANDHVEHVERHISREYNPMFVQKVTESFNEAPVVKPEADTNEGAEKLYVLESIDVPLSELNKYKHLNVINKLPENVVINDKELYADDGAMKFGEIDLTREKLYKSEFELEFEACQERKVHKVMDEIVVPKVVEPEVKKEEKKVEPPPPPPPEVEVKPEVKPEEEEKPKRKVKAQKLEKKQPKSKSILKLKEKVLKAAKVRIPKRGKKYSLNQRASSVKSLQSTCVDFLNTSGYRNFAREQLKIINKHSKMRILQEIKKKFNFEGIKKQSPSVNQKFNHSVQINSLREICGKLLQDKAKLLAIDGEEENEGSAVDEFPTLQELCKNVLNEMDVDVMENNYLFTPSPLKQLCETFIYTNSQYFVIEEVSSVPKLQDLCKTVLSETNIFINLDDEGETSEMFSLDDPAEALEDEPIYMVEENSGSVGELFESENLNSFERSEILRKIQRVASIEDDDEIIRAIGALHRDDDVESIINNNDSNVSNKNFRLETNEFSATNEEMKFDAGMSFMSLMDDDLVHSVQYEEIISVKTRGDKTSKIVAILRHKYLNRADVRQATKTINAILKKSLAYQRVGRSRNAERREKIKVLRERARAALSKLKSSDCDSEQHENESQPNAKDHLTAQSHQKSFQAIADESVDDSDDEAERKFPKLPVVFPSINEYKIDRKGSNRSGVKDMYATKRHRNRMNFGESLLSIDKMYGKPDEGLTQNQRRDKQRSDRSSTSSSSHYRSTKSRDDDRRKHHSSRNSHRHSSRSHRSRSQERDNGSRKSYHNSSRHNFYKNDQMKHSEAKRLVIPSYKIYDKDLDIKLKIMPYVRIEREEKVDDMSRELVNNYN